MKKRKTCSHLHPPIACSACACHCPVRISGVCSLWRTYLQYMCLKLLFYNTTCVPRQKSTYRVLCRPLGNTVKQQLITVLTKTLKQPLTYCFELKKVDSLQYTFAHESQNIQILQRRRHRIKMNGLSTLTLSTGALPRLYNLILFSSLSQTSSHLTTFQSLFSNKYADDIFIINKEH